MAVAGALISVASAKMAVLVSAAAFLLSVALLQMARRSIGFTSGGGKPDVGVSAGELHVLPRGSPRLVAYAVCDFLATGAWLSDYRLFEPVLAARSYGDAAGWTMFFIAYVADLLVGDVMTRWVLDSKPLLIPSVCSVAAVVAFLSSGFGLPSAVMVTGSSSAVVALGMAMDPWFVGCVEALSRRFLGRAMAALSSSELADGFTPI